jgi:cell division protein FtsB
VNAALLFFSTLRNDLVSSTPEYLEKELETLKREINQLAEEVKH